MHAHKRECYATKGKKQRNDWNYHSRYVLDSEINKIMYEETRNIFRIEIK